MQTISNKKEVRMNGFGTFSSKESAARAGRNPITGESLQIPAKQRIRFRPSKQFKEAVNKVKSDETL